MTKMPQPPHEPHPNHDRGLEFDLSTLVSRRSLGMFLGAGTAAALAACSPGGTSGTSGSSTSAAGTGGNSPGDVGRGDWLGLGHSDADPGDRRVRG